MSPVWAWLVPAFGLPGFYPSLVCMGPALPGLAHARADLAPAWACLLALVPAWLVLPAPTWAWHHAGYGSFLALCCTCFVLACPCLGLSPV